LKSPMSGTLMSMRAISGLLPGQRGARLCRAAGE
jgi:hypothetical protein